MPLLPAVMFFVFTAYLSVSYLSILLTHSCSSVLRCAVSLLSQPARAFSLKQCGPKTTTNMPPGRSTRLAYSSNRAAAPAVISGTNQLRSQRRFDAGHQGFHMHKFLGATHPTWPFPVFLPCCGPLQSSYIAQAMYACR
jgi:hypothetical protein